MQNLPFTRDLNKLYITYCCAFALAIIFPVLTVVFMIVSLNSLGSPVEAAEVARVISTVLLFGLFSLVPVFAAVVFFCIMLYRFWELVPKQNRKHGLGALIGFLFIPWFNLYWNFVAIWGCGKEYNSLFGGKKENLDLFALIICICLIFFPFISFIFLLFWLYQMKNAAIILQQNQ